MPAAGYHRPRRERTIIGAGVKIIGDSHGPVRIGNDVQILENTVLHLLPDNDLIIDHGAILTIDTPAALKRSLPGGHILDVWVRSGKPVAPRLENLPGVLRMETVASAGDEDGLERLRLFVDTGNGLLDRVLGAVREGGGDLDHVSLTQPSLEDVYIHLTGKELRE